jgi:hypothetical protein
MNFFWLKFIILKKNFFFVENIFLPLKQSQLVVNEISLVGEYKQEIHVDASVQLAHFL